jgi:tripartite-type tricarboxylate transporter receptor subunit TctC
MSKPSLSSFLTCRGAIALAALALLAAPAFAAWPTDKPIRVVVPFAAGGSGDVAFRTIQPHLEKALGASFYLDNKGGASGNIGATEVARAPADGYTLLLGATNNYVMNQFLFKMSFDPLKDLVPITMVVNSPLVVMVNPSVPVKTLAELTSYAKQNAGKVNFGSPGTGTAPHLGGVLFSQKSAAPLTHVPYRGAAPAVQGLVAGDIQAMFVTADSTSGYVLNGRLRALAVMGPKRLAALPDAPSMAELGMPELAVGNWWGLSAPANTDPAIINKLAAAVREAVSRPGVLEQFGKLGTTTVGNTPAEFAAQLARESATWRSVIETSQIKLD